MDACRLLLGVDDQIPDDSTLSGRIIRIVYHHEDRSGSQQNKDYPEPLDIPSSLVEVAHIGVRMLFLVHSHLSQAV